MMDFHTFFGSKKIKLPTRLVWIRSSEVVRVMSEILNVFNFREIAKSHE